MTDTFDPRRVTEMGEAERAQVERFLERRGLTLGPEAACDLCGLPGAVLRSRNGVAGHWHCPPPGTTAALQPLADLLDARRARPTSPASTTTAKPTRPEHAPTDG